MEKKQVIFITDDNDPYYGGGNVMGKIELDENNNLVINNSSLKVVIVGAKHLRLDVVEPMKLKFADDSFENEALE